MYGFANATQGFGQRNRNERAFGKAVVDEPKRPRVAQEIDAKAWRWAVARVRGGFEFAVADDLSAQGFLGYAPFGVKFCPSARVGGSNSVRRAAWRLFPVFGGYVFVGCPEGLYASRRAHDAVLGVLGDECGRPGVAASVIADINALELGGLWDARARPARVSPWRCGDRVAVELAGETLRAVVVGLTRAGVMVEASMLGRVVPVEIGFDKIKEAVI